MKESCFQMKIQKLMRIAIPKPVYESLDLHEGDVVDVTMRKVNGEELHKKYAQVKAELDDFKEAFRGFKAARSIDR